MDNGTNSPTSNDPPVNFGFTSSPGGESGDLWIDILAPNNALQGPSFQLTGTGSGTATLFSAMAWTSGSLESYLGISATPANPIGGYLPSTQAIDPGATGFFVYRVDLGSMSLLGPGNANQFPLENIGSGTLPTGSYIVAFLNQGTAANPNWDATANSGAIFETGVPITTRSVVPEPSTWAMLLLGFAGLGFAGYRKAKDGRIASTIA